MIVLHDKQNKEIKITCEEKVYYILSKVDDNGNNIIVDETIPDTADGERYYSIIKCCGNIKDNNTQTQ